MPGDASPTPLRILVVDDERLARQRLLRLLGDAGDRVETAQTGEEAAEYLQAARANDAPFDIVFLDVQMPGLSGLDVVKNVGAEHMPVTIFVTAYDQHALEAFELAALDYLLKPFEAERFHDTLQRAREIVELKKVGALRERLRALLEGKEAPPEEKKQPAAGKPAREPLRRIAVERRGQVRVVPIEDVDYFKAEGNYVRLHAGEESHLVSDTLSNLEDRLNADDFFRIHRSAIVRLDRVESFLKAPGGDYAVRLTDGTRLNVARGRRESFAERLGIEV